MASQRGNWTRRKVIKLKCRIFRTSYQRYQSEWDALLFEIKIVMVAQLEMKLDSQIFTHFALSWAQKHNAWLIIVSHSLPDRGFSFRLLEGVSAHLAVRVLWTGANFLVSGCPNRFWNVSIFLTWHCRHLCRLAESCSSSSSLLTENNFETSLIIDINRSY